MDQKGKYIYLPRALACTADDSLSLQPSQTADWFPKIIQHILNDLTHDIFFKGTTDFNNPKEAYQSFFVLHAIRRRFPIEPCAPQAFLARGSRPKKMLQNTPYFI